MRQINFVVQTIFHTAYKIKDNKGQIINMKKLCGYITLHILSYLKNQEIKNNCVLCIHIT